MKKYAKRFFFYNAQGGTRSRKIVFLRVRFTQAQDSRVLVMQHKQGSRNLESRQQKK